MVKAGRTHPFLCLQVLGYFESGQLGEHKIVEGLDNIPIIILQIRLEGNIKMDNLFGIHQQDAVEFSNVLHVDRENVTGHQ